MALLPMLEHGAEGLHEMMQEARDLGIVMSQEDAEAAAEFNDNMLRLQARIDAVKFTIARHLVPALIELQNWLGPRITQSVRWLVDIWDNRLQPTLSAGVAQIRELGAALGFLEGGGETELHPALQWIADNQELLQVVGAIAAGILTAVIAFKAITAAIAGATAAAAAVKLAFAGVLGAIGLISIPVLIVAAAIGILVGGFILLYKRSDAFRSFIHDKLLPALGRLAEWLGTNLPLAFEAVKQWVDRYVTPAMEAIWIKAQEAWEKLSPILAAIRDAVIATLGRAVSWVRAHWEPISTVLKAPFLLAWLGIVATLDMIKTAVEIALQLITGDWEGAIDSLAGYVERSKERMIEAFKVLLDVGEVLHAAGQALGQKILEGMALALGSIGDVIGGAVGGAFSGIGLPDINIPGFAAGGVVPATPGGRIVRVGEGGRDEAIVPLGRGGGGAGGNTYITIDAALGDPDAIADRLYPVLQALERRGTISIITAGA